MENALMEHLSQLHTTEMGAVRICRNLGIQTDPIGFCRAVILAPGAAITRQGKNWYVRVNGNVITVNAFSYTVITAHRETKSRV